MIDAPRMLLLGSTGRNSGRTDFACALISRLRSQHRIVAVKVTIVKDAELTCSRECEGCGVCTNLKEEFAITRERDEGRGKDTERMAAAGADTVCWLRVRREEYLLRAITALLDEIGSDAYILCESNTLRSAVAPGAFLLFDGQEQRGDKPGSIATRDQADRVVLRTTEGHDLSPEDVEICAGTWAVPLEAAAILLAGGLSQRMQTDKSMLPIGGVPMIEHIHRQLRPHFRRTLVSANDVEKYAFLGVPVVPDLVPDQGPLMGIASALATSGEELNFATACDMPAIDMALVRRMLREAKGYDAVIPNADGSIEPLFAVYRGSMGEAMRATLAAGKRRIRDAFEGQRVKYLEIDARDAPRNLNTRAEYDGFVAKMGSGHINER